MIDENHVRWIIDDIKKDIPLIEQAEEYEALISITKMIEDMESYIAGDAEYDQISSHLMVICMSRYSIFRLVTIGQDRFVVFLINYPGIVTLYVDGEKEETPLWKQLQEDCRMQDKDLADIIEKNFFTQDESDGPGEDTI